MRFSVSSELHEEIKTQSTIILSVHALRTPSQAVLQEPFVVKTKTAYEQFVSQSGEDRFVRFGNIEANYQKVVDCRPVDAA